MWRKFVLPCVLLILLWMRCGINAVTTFSVGSDHLLYANGTLSVLCADNSYFNARMAMGACGLWRAPTFYPRPSGDVSSINGSYSFFTFANGICWGPDAEVCTTPTLSIMTMSMGVATVNSTICQNVMELHCQSNCSLGLSNSVQKELLVAGGTVCGDDMTAIDQLKRTLCNQFTGNGSISFVAGVVPVNATSTLPFLTLKTARQGAQSFADYCLEEVQYTVPNQCVSGPVTIKCQAISEDYFPGRARMSNRTGVVRIGSKQDIICADTTYFDSGMAQELCTAIGQPASFGITFTSRPLSNLYNESELAQMSFKTFNESCKAMSCDSVDLYNTAVVKGACDNALVINCSKPCTVGPAGIAHLSDTLLCGDKNIQPLLDAYCDLAYPAEARFAKTEGGPAPSELHAPLIQITKEYDPAYGQSFNDFCRTSAELSPSSCASSVIFECTEIKDCTTAIDANHFVLNRQPGMEDATAYLTSAYLDDQMRNDLCGQSYDTYPKVAKYFKKNTDALIWYDLGSAGCKYADCDEKRICNFATREPSLADKMALAIDCNVTFELRLNNESSTNLINLPQEWFRNCSNCSNISYVGRIEARPALPGNPLPWTGISNRVMYGSFVFTDNAALLFCRAMFPEQNFTNADALVNYGATSVIGITNLICSSQWVKQGFSNFTTNILDNPLNHPTLCQYAYVQTPWVAWTKYKFAPAITAIGVHCGASTCKAFSNFETVGAFCGADKNLNGGPGMFKGINVWISVADNGTMLMNVLSDEYQPWNYTQANISKYMAFQVTGTNCRLDPAGYLSWKDFFGINTDELVEVTLKETTDAFSPESGLVTTVIVTFDDQQGYFFSCNSCPSTSPDGTYCGAGYYYVYHDFDANIDAFDYYRNPNDAIADCSRVKFTLSMDLPGKPCRFKYNLDDCPAMEDNSIFGISFNVELGTLYELDSSLRVNSKAFTLCSKPKVVECPTSISKRFCGVSTYKKIAVTVAFHQDNTLNIKFEPSKNLWKDNIERPLLCPGEGSQEVLKYSIRRLSQTIGCIIDIPVFSNFHGCLANTTLFGKAQGKQPVVLSPDGQELLWNFLDDTYHLPRCRQCVPDYTATYCSLSGNSILSFPSATEYSLRSMRHGYKSVTSVMNMDETVCGAVMANQNDKTNALIETNEGLPDNWWITESYLKDYSVYGALEASFTRGHYFLHPPSDLYGEKGLLNTTTGLQDVIAGEEFQECNSRTVPVGRYCSLGALEYRIEVVNALNMNFYATGRYASGAKINATYILLPNTAVNISFETWQALIQRDAIWERLVNFVYLSPKEKGDDAYLLLYLENFGYNRFEPCKESYIFQTLGWIAAALFGVGTLGFLIKKNVQARREAREAAQAAKSGDDESASFKANAHDFAADDSRCFEQREMEDRAEETTAVNVKDAEAAQQKNVNA